MSKRSLSPVPLPPSKRIHTALEEPLPGEVLSTFDNVLSDEIVLFIFSYLAPSDLCTIQRTNRNWARLSLDNQLWKSLYIREYGRTRLRGARGFIGRGDGREIKPLPSRAKSEDVKDWKWMFRISSNWRTGRCSLEHLDLGASTWLFSQVQYQTHLLLAGNMSIMASSEPSARPAVVLTSPGRKACTLPCPPNRSGVMVRITSIALDQSPPSSRHHGKLVCILSTGEFSLFSIDHQSPSSSSRLLTYQPPGRSSRTAPIVQAAYHHPLLVTLSQTFHLSLYDLSSNSVKHTQTLTSFTSYPPSSLVLSAQSLVAYKLILAYATPVYPSHWSVGATELIITSEEASEMTVSNTRTTRTIDVPQGWVDEHKMRAVREQWSRKVARVADTQTDGKWVVLAPGQFLPAITSATPTHPGSASLASSSTPPSSPGPGTIYTSSSLHTASGLQLYRLYLPSSTSSSSSPKLTFVRTLHGQIGPVSTLALADGRCVSLGMNGSIWVWDLEAGTGVEVSPGITGPADDARDGDEDEDPAMDPFEAVKLRAATGAQGSVIFDDRRIVSSHGTEVEIRRFDV